MRDPYEVLGVARTADAAAIKSAYRKLAKKLHPDTNKNDATLAQRFAELNSAYEILGDAAKRKQYDAGEIDAEGKPKFQGYEGFGAHPGGGFGGREGAFESFTWGPEGFQRTTTRGGGRRGGGGGAGAFEDILKDMFGGFSGGRRGGQGPQFEFEEAGPAPVGQDITTSVTATLADAARGAKLRVRLPTGKEVEVKLPVGIADGQQVRLKGQGLAGPRGVGDALVTVHVAADPLFKREGDNLRLELPITLYEAVLGARVRVPTLDGAVQLAIPPGTSSGRVFRLKGKGMPGKGGAGDLLATIRIVLPDHSDPGLEDLMRTWQTQKPYNPRKDFEER
ncbi:MAG TPA: DnaJ C-terminal domain-containing protein [Xanthobacteraceae bacterium]|nr:DnaJ C-terminal domain-containing protein [Xanthobacteraceae bacterium]